MTFLIGDRNTGWHGVYHGDAMELSRYLPDESIDMIYTDPPYDGASLPLYEWVAWAAARLLKPGGFVAMMCGGIWLHEVFRLTAKSGLDFYWLFQYGMNGSRTGRVFPRGTGMPIITRHKHVLVYSKGRSQPMTAMYSPFNGKTGADKAHHPWGQSVESARYYVEAFTQSGDLVLDPFVGGGTTAIACAVLGRRWLGFDVDNEAITVARQRIMGADLPLFSGWSWGQRMALFGALAKDRHD